MFENLFSHWVFWLVITVVVIGFLLVARERGFRDKLKGSIDGQKFWLGFKAEWLEKNFSRVMSAIAIAGVVLMIFGCSGGTVKPDLLFSLFATQAGPFVGAVDSSGHITGQQQEGGKEWAHGVLNGTFTASGHL